MTKSSKFEFATLNRKYVANADQPVQAPAFRSLFSSLKDDLLQSQELLQSREEAAANRREGEVRKEVETLYQQHHKAGFEEGYAKGYEAKQSEQEQFQQQMQAVLSAIKTACEAQFFQRKQAVEQQVRDTISLAKVIAKKLVDSAEHGALLSHLEASLTAHIPVLMESERVKITVNKTLASSLQTQMEQLLQASGFTGKITVIGDVAMGVTDCVLEWDEGAIKKNRQTIEKMIDTMCEQAIHTAT